MQLFEKLPVEEAQFLTVLVRSLPFLRESQGFDKPIVFEPCRASGPHVIHSTPLKRIVPYEQFPSFLEPLFPGMYGFIKRVYQNSGMVAWLVVGKGVKTDQPKGLIHFIDQETQPYHWEFPLSAIRPETDVSVFTRCHILEFPIVHLLRFYKQAANN